MVLLFRRAFPFLLILVFERTAAQFNLPLITQYYTNPYVWNPAQAGGYDYPVLYLTYKDQWTGIKGHPEIESFTYNQPVFKSSGLGVSVYNDKAGFLSRTKAVVSFSQYIFIDAENQYLSFGLSGGVITQRIDLSQVDGEAGKGVDPLAQIYNTNSPTYPDLDFGTAYHYKGLNLDLVFPNLLKFTVKNRSLQSTFSGLPIFFTSFGYNFTLNDDWSVHPKVALRKVSDFANLLTVSSMVTWRESLSVGAFYHTDKTLTASVGLMIDRNWDLNYAYTQNNASLRRYFSDTHEISIGYHFSDGHQSRSSKNLLIKCPATSK